MNQGADCFIEFPLVRIEHLPGCELRWSVGASGTKLALQIVFIDDPSLADPPSDKKALFDTVPFP